MRKYLSIFFIMILLGAFSPSGKSPLLNSNFMTDQEQEEPRSESDDFEEHTEFA